MRKRKAVVIVSESEYYVVLFGTLYIVEEAAVLFCSRSNQQQQRPSSLYIVGQQRSCQSSLPVLILFYPVDQSLSVSFLRCGARRVEKTDERKV